jgi:preprotein translocase subunit SecY
MEKKGPLSTKTRKNWLIDAALALGGLLAALSGIYFLYLPSGGYHGGRNPLYGVTILFERHTWEELHTWSGVAMIVVAAVHLAIHWRWVKMMARRVVDTFRTGGAGLAKRTRANLAVNAVVAVSFVLVAVSGIYFLLWPAGSDAKTAWDVIHTWSGVVMIAATAVHFAIHWRWVRNVTARMAWSLGPARKTAVAQMPADAQG